MQLAYSTALADRTGGGEEELDLIYRGFWVYFSMQL